MAKYYSNATDLITFARSSSATYLDSDGVIKTATTNAPRIDYDADRTLKGLLIEEQRTNLLHNTDNPPTQVANLAAGSHTLSFYGGTSASSISDSITGTAVDVFVYDTKRDSDGGAWRTGSLAQASSWYNETLNTSTRGGRKEFPSVAVIVAEEHSITIYDGDDPSLPMWMAFPANKGALGGVTSAGLDLTSVAMLNGVLVGGYGNGLSYVNLLSEVLERGASVETSNTGVMPFNVAERDQNPAGLGGTLNIRIVNSAVNDVAMTVLPNAPTDPATGLPVPTIAVATDGGTSVIHDDGTVYDLTRTGGHNTLAIFDGDKVVVNRASGGYDVFVHQLPLTADTTDYTGELLHYSFVGNVHTPLIMGQNAKGFAADVLSGSNGVAFAAPDYTTPNSTLVAHTTSDYTTGWMNGDIKLAALADTIAETLSDANALDDDFTGYADETAFLAAGYQYNGSAASFNATSDAVEFTAGAGSLELAGAIHTSIPNGSHVHVQVTVSNRTAGTLNLQNNYATEAVINGGGMSANGIFDYLVTKNGLLRLTSNGTFDGQIDNISARLADPDRSVNGNGLGVHGSITKAAVETGADVVAYSGFSGSNYLEQPYNSDLDFGTGDFCVMGWVKGAATQSTANIASRCSSATDGFQLYKFTTSSTPYAIIRIGSTYISGTTGITDQWNHVVAVRKDGVAYVYKNGVLENSASATADVSGSFVTQVGWSTASSLVHGLHGIALLRISGTAPTADQIKKIYDDEKLLFQPNAKATLDGTSDAVTALAHDPETDLLHVGTSQSRSVFYGLRRINQTGNAVTTAISAVDGLISEQ